MDHNMFYDQIKDAEMEVVEYGKFAKTFRLAKYPDSDSMACYLVFLPFAVIITGDLRVENHGLQAIGYGLDWFRDQHEPRYLAEKFLQESWQPEAACRVMKSRLEDWKAIQQEERAEYEQECKQDLEAALENGNDAPQFAPFVSGYQELLPRKWRVGNHELDNATIIEALEYLLADEGDFFTSADRLYESLPCYQEQAPRSYKDLPFLLTAPVYRCAFEGDDLSGGYDYPEASVGWLAAINRRFSECYAVMEGCLP